jgi:hypothetical protein
MGKIESTEAGLELKDSVANKISKMLDRFNQRLTLDNLRLIERYIKAEIVLLIHFHINGGQYVAYLQRAHVVSGPEKGGHPGEITRLERRSENSALLSHSPGSPHGRATKIQASECAPDSDNNAVLVDVVQAVKHPKLVPLPSFVRFELAKRINSVLPQAALYFSLKVVGGIRGGEIEVLVRSGGAKPNDQQVIGQMIKSAPEILDCITSDGDDDSRGGSDLGYLIAHFTKLRIYIFDDGIGLGAEEGVDLAMEIDDVLFGPFNFYHDERKLFIGIHS